MKLRLLEEINADRLGDGWLTRAAVERVLPQLVELTAQVNTHIVRALPSAARRRPAAYLDPRVRRACSALTQTRPEAVERGLHHLRQDLDSGRWHEQHKDLLCLDQWDAGFRLIVSHT